MMFREVVLALTLVAPPSVALHVQVGAGAGVPAVDRGAVWVPNTGDGTVSRVSPGGEVVATVALGAGAGAADSSTPRSSREPASGSPAMRPARSTA